MTPPLPFLQTLVFSEKGKNVIDTFVTEADHQGNIERYINGIKEFVPPFVLTPDDPNQRVTLAAAVNDTETVVMSVSQEGPVQIMNWTMQSNRFTAVADHEATIDIYDSSANRHFMNRPIHLNTMMGTPGFPGLLPEWLFLHENRSLRIQFQNIFANENTLRLNGQGRRFYKSSARAGDLEDRINKILERQAMTHTFYLTTTEEISDLAYGDSDTWKFDPTTEWFVVYKVTSLAYDTQRSEMVDSDAFNIRFQDAKTGRDISNDTLSSDLITGTGLYPWVLPESWLIPPKKEMTVEIENTNPWENPIDVYITLIGVKVYAE